jgi:hypothetical protein
MCHVSYGHADGHADGHAVCCEACNVVRRIDLGHVSRCMLCAGRAVACVRSVPLGRLKRVREPRRASIEGRGGRIWSMIVWRSERRGWGSTGPMHWDMEHMVAGDHPAFLGLPARLRSSTRNRRARKGRAVRSYTLLRSLRHCGSRVYKGARRPAHPNAAGWAGKRTLCRRTPTRPRWASEALRLIHDAYYCAVTNLTLRLI